MILFDIEKVQTFNYVILLIHEGILCAHLSDHNPKNPLKGSSIRGGFCRCSYQEHWTINGDF